MDAQDRDRLSTVGELSTILAHEIKNPMNSIIINIEVLRAAILEVTGGYENSASTRAKKYLDVIEGEVKRLDKVIKGFLDLSLPSQSTKVKFGINQVLQSVVDFMAQEMKQKGIRLQTDFSKENPSLFGSSDQMKQALINLMLNSLQAQPNGGEVSIKTSSTDKWVLISIQDAGFGMDERTLEKIFNPYFTTKDKGSGLGLTIVRRVVKEHHGDIRIESEVGKGTTFHLNFPKKISECA
ncbi:MAG: GHKL domain-containing protein [Deltaproteobacteria bacterium]|nr:GHKL domain-containing protein [Deltaproteobacteria bacterium]